MSNDCRFCVAADKRIYPDKTTEEIKNELKEAFSNEAGEVVFSGGECTLRDDIFEIVRFAKKLGFLSIQIQTNGRRFASLDFCKKMLAAGMTEFGPALHGHTSELHDFLTRSRGSFRQTVLGIHNMKTLTKNSHVRILTNTVITKYNYQFLPQIADLLIRLGVHQYQFAFVHALGNAGRAFHDVVPRKSDCIPYVKQGLDLGIKKGMRVMAEAITLCLMKGYIQYATEFYIPPTEVRERGITIEKFEDVRRNDGKVKFPQCQRCRYTRVCEGPWKEYPQIFGDSEFKPVLEAS